MRHYSITYAAAKGAAVRKAEKEKDTGLAGVFFF
jgi:hypothetical protein